MVDGDAGADGPAWRAGVPGSPLDPRARRPIVKGVPNQRVELDRVFQALSDGTRRAIVERLVRGPASVTQLAEPLAMSLPSVMQHLQVLEACGLVRSEKVGRTRTCRIDPDALRAAEGWLAGQRTAWESRLDRLGEMLTEAAEQATTTGDPDGPRTTARPSGRRHEERDR